ncbi:uncharacterized protein LOC119078376 [Bradysia coprophila]|uniref:uncharacterized protein LOC119078376 n=1 Tax=Bradysia coprophila TaxID=38358 RepID=UPI00187DB9FD|nr:uncharacterized protein LOC119078376 [Bradysia coprophila]
MNQTQVNEPAIDQSGVHNSPENQLPENNQVIIQPPIQNPCGRMVDYKKLCKSSVNLTRSQIASRHTMNKSYPAYSGEPTKWQMFESAFVNATISCGLTNAENLSRLLECLKGDALNAVQGLLLHPESVPGLMETLRLMFGRPELIIQTLLDEINKSTPPKSDDLKSLVKFAISVQNLCSTIKAFNSVEHLRNPSMLKDLVEKLPTQVKLNWAFYKQTVVDVNLSTLADWLYALATVASDVVITVPDSQADKKIRKDDNKTANYINSTNSLQPVMQVSSNSGAVTKNQKKCPACNRNVCKKLAFCEKFKKMTRQERWRLIKSNNICGCCLGNHRYFNCNQKVTCGVAGCDFFHHVLLHNDSKAKEKVELAAATSEVVQKKVCNSMNGIASTLTYPEIFRIVPKLGLQGTQESLCVKWSFGETQLETDSSRISLQISGVHDGAEKFLLDDVRTVKNLKLPTQSIPKDWLAKYPYFDGIPITPYNNATPQMIIGLRYSKLMVSLKTIEGTWEQPIACKTRLGWVVQGPNDRRILNSNKFSLNMCDCQRSYHGLHQLVKDFFSLEAFGVQVTDSVVESKTIMRARSIMDASTVKIDQHYETALLWRANDITLPKSYDMALRRLECVESKMKKNPILSDRIINYFKDFLDKGYIRKLSFEEQQLQGPRTWCLPVFPVFNPKKPEKLRLVWDGAAKVNGVSLNSQLLPGPDQLVPLPDILRRFREARIGLSTDIIEMFHRVFVNSKDQDAQRFLWRDGDVSKKPDVFVVKVLPFGLTCSPAIAQYVKNKNAESFQQQYPKAVEAIVKNHYVDDMIERAHDVDSAVQLIKDVQFIHRHANFDLRNLISNDREVLEVINGSPEFNDKILVDKLDINVERILGMYWNTNTDTFTYSLRFLKVQDLTDGYRPTKLDVLRTLMSVFDPLGFLTHLLIHAKVILQEIWITNITWDEQIPEALAIKWLRWLEYLKQVESLHISRLYSPRMSPNKPTSIQLHVFVDASLEAYASVAYFRVEDANGVDSCLIGAKSRVAPIKPISVPRLELQGGILGKRFAESILHSHSYLEVEQTTIWCDSKTFVAFRIGEILETKINAQWRWIPSEFNVADDATKTKYLPELRSTSRWFRGPEFLRHSNSNFSFELDEPDFTTNEEVRPYYLLTHVEVPVNKFIEYERFSNWQRLVRTMAYVLRFVSNVKTKQSERRLGVLSSDELLSAECRLFAQVQYDCFREEISIIRSNQTVSMDKYKQLDKTSPIRMCSPYLDDSGVLRVMGRLDKAHTISESVRRPIILIKDHYVTHLVVDWYHRKYLHLHHQTVLNEIRQKFWIPKLRVLLKVIRHNYQKCKNDASVPRVPEMGSIPRERFAVFTRPFTYVGIDYFGPIKVVVNRSNPKRWGALFTCLTTRAIHLEVAHSMDTSSCIMCIRNFIGRRGTPKKVHVDLVQIIGILRKYGPYF